MRVARPLPARGAALKKWVNGVDLSDKNAFVCDACVEMELRLPRALGATGAALLLVFDDGGERELPFCFFACMGAWDSYRLTLPLFDITPETGGFVQYYVLLYRGAERLFSKTEDNISLDFSKERERAFSLLAYRRELTVPRRFQGRVMYQILVDRFARGSVPCPVQGVFRTDFAGEIGQYAAAPGEPVANNEFFGGTLWGVLEHLDRLQALGVGILYLCPILEARSNHKYDTGDYERVAAEFGGERALRALAAGCRKRDMLLLLDGVFNHTGDDSRYFDKYGNYGGHGAFSDPSSPYRDWYFWREEPPGYECWWGIPILPKLRLENPAVREYFLGERGIVARYLEMGIDAWRLDVADELPNSFLEALHTLVKEKTDGNGAIFGEVWENAADKIAYGSRRRYFWGDQLDGVMNYPLRRGILEFVRNGDAPALCRVLRELWSSYPTPVCHMLMNHLSTHDTARAFTVLGGAPEEGQTRAALCAARMSEAERTVARRRVCIAATLQYTLFGIPCVFYGEEAGMEGYGDPFCRRTYPWGREDNSLLTFYKKLGKIRGENTVFCDGDFTLLAEHAHALVFSRRSGRDTVIVAANCGEEEIPLRLPRAATELLGGRHAAGEVTLAPDTACIWRIDDV